MQTTLERGFKSNPEHFRDGQPYVDGVEWLVVEDASATLTMCRSGQLDCGPAPWGSMRQEDLESVKKTQHVKYQDFLSLAEWSPRIDDLGAGAKYYQLDPIYSPTRARAIAIAQSKAGNEGSIVDFPIGGFSPPKERLARGFKPPAFSRFLFQSAVKSAESF